MNNSGESVAALAKFYRVPPKRVLVISDDLDQPVAQVRIHVVDGRIPRVMGPHGERPAAPARRGWANRARLAGRSMLANHVVCTHTHPHTL